MRRVRRLFAGASCTHLPGTAPHEATWCVCRRYPPYSSKYAFTQSP